MRKLMILAVAMIAMAMGGKADAALRLVMTSGASTAVFYYESDTSGAVIFNFSVGGYTGVATLLTSNFPGTVELGSLAQQITISSSTGPGVLSPLTSTLDVINAIALNTPLFDPPGPALPGSYLGPVTDATDINNIRNNATLKNFTAPLGAVSVSSSGSLSTNSSTTAGSMYAMATVTSNAVTLPVTTNTFNINQAAEKIVLFPGSGTVTPGYTLTNTLRISGLTPASGAGVTGVVAQSTSSVQPIVPEPTSLALAGFAGIGMAVGAIRRRRQAKQAA